MSNELKSYSFVPQNYDQAFAFANMIAESAFAPKEMRNKPGEVFIAMQMGAELGLQPMQALQNIAVINGRPSVWGDAAMALVRSHPECESIEESFDESTMTAKCSVKRKGHLVEMRTFSQKDAEKAKLWGKQGPWSQYPKRMLQMRARGFAIRDVFADALRGLSFAEEARDIPEEKDITHKAGEAQEQSALEKLQAKREEKKEDNLVVEEHEVVISKPDEVGIAIEEPPEEKPMTYAQIADVFNNCKTATSLKKGGEMMKKHIDLLPEDQRGELETLYIGLVKELKEKK